MWPDGAYVGSATPKKQEFSILGARWTPKNKEFSVLGARRSPKIRNSLF